MSFKLFKPMMRYTATTLDDIVGFIPADGQIYNLRRHRNGRNWVTKGYGEIVHPSHFMYSTEWWNNSPLGHSELSELRALLDHNRGN